MKRKIVLFVISLFLSYSVFAANDFQLNLGHVEFQPLTLINHNYWDKNQCFGVGETISIGAQDNPYVSILVGPAFRKVLGSGLTEMQIISGFKFYYCNIKNISYGNYTDIELINDCINTGYAWGTDFQLKLFANKLISIILGSSFAVGMNSSWTVQKPVDKNKIAVYKPISGKKKFDPIYDIQPYIGFSINIK